MNFLTKIMPYDYQEILSEVIDSDRFAWLANFVEDEYAKGTVYPLYQNIFRALYLTPFSKVRVVILGQDPYHEEHQAQGLSFSVPKGVPYPPSLRNIFQEYVNDTRYPNPSSGDLTSWAKQGVLLLNTVLTVRKSQANSHANCGWEEVTDGIIEQLSKRQERVIFVLWGKSAQSKARFIAAHHHIIKSSHPSPLSAYRGFFGSAPFAKINAKLTEWKKPIIDWKLS